MPIECYRELLDKADREEKERGRTWYADAHKSALKIAAEAGSTRANTTGTPSGCPCHPQPQAGGGRCAERGRGAMRVGFMAVKGLGERTVRRLIEARAERPFESLADFYGRVRPMQAEAEALILVGAFDAFDRTRPQLLWELELLAKERPRSSDTPLLPGEGMGVKVSAIPELPEFSFAQRIAFEQEHLEMTPTAQPLACCREALAEAEVTPAAELPGHVGEQVRVAGVLVASRRARTKANLFMEFLTLEDETGLVEVTLFPRVYQKYGGIIRSRGPFLVEGTVEDQFGALTLSAQRLRAVTQSALSPTPS